MKYNIKLYKALWSNLREKEGLVETLRRNRNPMFNLPVLLSSPLTKLAMLVEVQAHNRHLGEAGTMLVPCSLVVLAQTPKAGR
jgi:hypothetical protein